VIRTTTGRDGIERWSALGGVVFVVLFVIGNILIFGGGVSGDDPPAKVAAYFDDSGHRDRIHIGWILAGLGVFSFLWFVAALREAVRRREGDGMLATLVLLGGSIYAAVAFAAVAMNEAVRTMSDDTYRHTVYPEVIHAADDASYVMHATGSSALALLIVAASLAFVRAGAPKWVLWVGIVVALAAIATIVFFTTLIWLAWVLVVSGFLFIRGTPGRVTPASAATPL
jgi:hypothetical protein